MCQLNVQTYVIPNNESRAGNYKFMCWVDLEDLVKGLRLPDNAYRHCALDRRLIWVNTIANENGVELETHVKSTACGLKPECVLFSRKE